jgi:hypothetical protein
MVSNFSLQIKICCFSACKVKLEPNVEKGFLAAFDKGWN